MKRILVVDDEYDLCEILQFNLENEGYQVDTALSAEDALKKLRPDHSLMLLDVMMDGMSGYQLAKKLRNEMHNNIPIIFLTAKNSENDMLTGFSIGGDDYIAKPFSVKEVLARVKAVIRRVESLNTDVESDVINFDDLVLNKKHKSVTVKGETVNLTKKEYLILLILLENKGNYLERDTILKNVWDDETYVLERTVDVHVARLRKKLGTLGEHISSRAGFGYSWIDK
ncbi:MAG TPA: response regulator transcription factor [Bacteroidetes bacterium]|nr:response regulator transcription factor [Candidatus Limimorpha avicola]